MNLLEFITGERAGAVERKGVLRAHKWWLLRRATQLGLLGLFMIGPLAGIWWVRGNFASSQILGTVPLTDPYIFLQSLAAGMRPETIALTGAAIVTVFYVVVGGRTYCSWVCPVNIVTDAAYWLRQRLNIQRDRKLSRSTRMWILFASLIASFLTGTIAWEFVNPVGILQRALIFGIGSGWVIVALVFAFDLFVSRRGWCSHLCPVGAFYGVLGRSSLVRINAVRRDACTSCNACLRDCPEPHVNAPALKGKGTSFITSGDCVNCGGCIDSCPNDVYRMDLRIPSRSAPPPTVTEVGPPS